MGFMFSDHDGSLYWERGSDEGRELTLEEAKVIAATEQAAALRYIGQALHEVAEVIESASFRLEPKNK